MKDLSVITVTHQSASFIEEQVFSVISGGLKVSMEQIIVDNASTDGTQDILDRLEMVGCKVIKNEKNVGFSKANNQALAHARGHYLLFLNPDMRVQEGSLDELVSWMDAQSEVGICSCLLVDPLGRPVEKNSARQLPPLIREILWLLCLDREKAEIGDETPEMVKGAFMLVRRELVSKLGFAFDPRYFLLFEDADLCQEAETVGIYNRSPSKGVVRGLQQSQLFRKERRMDLPPFLQKHAAILPQMETVVLLDLDCSSDSIGPMAEEIKKIEINS